MVILAFFSRQSPRHRPIVDPRFSAGFWASSRIFAMMTGRDLALGEEPCSLLSSPVFPVSFIALVGANGTHGKNG